MVRSQLSRFIVPFSFSPERYGELYAQTKAREKAVRKGSVPFWELWQPGNAANEFFPFLNVSLDGENPQSVGSLWRPGRQNQFHGELFYRVPKGDIEKRAYVNCQLAVGGLALFKTGVGFAWFEVKMSLWPNFPNKKDAKMPALDQIIDINNYCKDIYHRGDACNQERFVFYPRFVYPEDEAPPQEGCEKETFSIFLWLLETFFQPMGEIEFFAPQVRRSKESADASRPLVGPNKAHIFTNIYLDRPESVQEETKSLYWLRKGYRSSYLPSQETLDPQSQEVFPMFENEVCGVCFEGCAFLSYHTGQKQTDVVFENNWEPMIANYFLLYLVSLHQHYILLRLSARMAQLPCQIDHFGAREYRKLLTLQEELGLAYTKAFFPRVSYIGHQNTVYDRFREVLSIERLQTDLAQRMAVLSELTQSYRQRKLERIGHVLTVTGGIFVVLQTLNNVLGIFEMEPRLSALGRWGFAGLVMLVSLLLGVIFTALWHREDGRKGTS